MRISKLKDTAGITLRLPVDTLAACHAIAARANLLDIGKGGRGLLTAQDVMRHQLAKLPGLKKRASA